MSDTIKYSDLTYEARALYDYLDEFWLDSRLNPNVYSDLEFADAETTELLFKRLTGYSTTQVEH